MVLMFEIWRNDQCLDSTEIPKIQIWNEYDLFCRKVKIGMVRIIRDNKRRLIDIGIIKWRLRPEINANLSALSNPAAGRLGMEASIEMSYYSRRSAAGSVRTKVTRCHKRKCRCRSRSNILRHNHPKTLYLAQFLCL